MNNNNPAEVVNYIKSKHHLYEEMVAGKPFNMILNVGFLDTQNWDMAYASIVSHSELKVACRLGANSKLTKHLEELLIYEKALYFKQFPKNNQSNSLSLQKASEFFPSTLSQLIRGLQPREEPDTRPLIDDIVIGFETSKESGNGICENLRKLKKITNTYTPKVWHNTSSKVFELRVLLQLEGLSDYEQWVCKKSDFSGNLNLSQVQRESLLKEAQSFSKKIQEILVFEGTHIISGEEIQEHAYWGSENHAPSFNQKPAVFQKDLDAYKALCEARFLQGSVRRDLPSQKRNFGL